MNDLNLNGMFKSTEKEKVYCKNCKWFQKNYSSSVIVDQECNHTENFIDTDTYLGPKTRRVSYPGYINSNNDCEWYEDKNRGIAIPPLPPDGVPIKPRKIPPKDRYAVNGSMIFFLILVIVLIIYVGIVSMCSCNGEIDSPIADNQVLAIDSGVQKYIPFCGNWVCDKENGETWQNCEDCINPWTGEPVSQLCGDGFCSSNENMKNCWKDCRPIQINNDPAVGPGGKEPKPGPL